MLNGPARTRRRDLAEAIAWDPPDTPSGFRASTSAMRALSASRRTSTPLRSKRSRATWDARVLRRVRPSRSGSRPLLMRSTFLIEVVGRFPGRDRLPRVRLGFVEASLPPHDLRADTVGSRSQSRRRPRPPAPRLPSASSLLRRADPATRSRRRDRSTRSRDTHALPCHEAVRCLPSLPAPSPRNARATARPRDMHEPPRDAVALRAHGRASRRSANRSSARSVSPRIAMSDRERLTELVRGAPQRLDLRDELARPRHHLISGNRSPDEWAEQFVGGRSA